MPLDPHMSRDMFSWYLKEHLLEIMQKKNRVGHLPKKLVIKGKIEPLSSQKVGPKNKQHGITKPKYCIMLFKMRKF
jgi:hypothetical protein